MRENESKDAALDTKDFLTDDLKEGMYMELNERYKDLIGNLLQYVADMLKLQIDEKGGITGKGYELARFLTLMNVACDCEIKASCDENGNIHCDSQKASRFLHAMFCISEDAIEWATNLKEWAYAEAEKAGLFLLCEELKPFPNLKAQKRSDDK